MFDCELVGKIGSMALIRRDDYDIDYNVFSNVVLHSLRKTYMIMAVSLLFLRKKYKQNWEDI